MHVTHNIIFYCIVLYRVVILILIFTFDFFNIYLPKFCISHIVIVVS